MKFGPVPLREAAGAILAHSVSVDGKRIKKGTRLTSADVEALATAGMADVIVAVPSADDVLEDDAAGRVAAAIAGEGIRVSGAFTGRANAYATGDGVLLVDRQRLVDLNLIDEGITIATLSPHARVTTGQMVSTTKIIPFALPAGSVDQAVAAACDPKPATSVAAFRRCNAGLILTTVSGTKDRVLDKRRHVTDERLTSAGSRLVASETVQHDQVAISKAIRQLVTLDCDPILIFGGSAIVDRSDEIPAALAAVGGEVRHVGMPVDPGNLLMYGRLDGRTVIGVPSCAGSPKLNGLDWVLERTLAGLDITAQDFAEMAPGGLLMEIGSRPQPRERAEPPLTRRAPRIAAVVLAAGRSTRMGERNKLTEQLDGTSLVRHVVDAARASRAAEVVVVTGHQPDEVREAIAVSADVRCAHNPEFADGLSTSLRAGIGALGGDIDGAVVLLGDMPRVGADLIDKLIAAFAPEDGRGICVPRRDGRTGNPVLWSSGYFPEILGATGDIGARFLISQHEHDVAYIDVDSDAIFADIDTPQELQAARQGGTAG